MDHFSLFDIPADLHIDASALKKKYYKLSREYHPDHATDLPFEEQQRFTDVAMQINQAYAILGNEKTRAAYLLELAGSPIGESGNILPQHFLMEMMDINEAIMDAKMEDNSEALQAALEPVETFKLALEQQFNRLKEQIRLATITEEQIQGLKEYLLKQRYLSRIEELLTLT